MAHKAARPVDRKAVAQVAVLRVAARARAVPRLAFRCPAVAVCPAFLVLAPAVRPAVASQAEALRMAAREELVTRLTKASLEGRAALEALRALPAARRVVKGIQQVGLRLAGRPDPWGAAELPVALPGKRVEAEIQRAVCPAAVPVKPGAPDRQAKRAVQREAPAAPRVAAERAVAPAGAKGVQVP